jgi:LmbE family N-acetylglucosaminyl deacetylase
MIVPRKNLGGRTRRVLPPPGWPGRIGETAKPMRILVVYAHPDDESFGPAAALAAYARRGAEIWGIFASRGERGESWLSPAPSPEELGRLREQDLREATAVLGFAGIEILGYPDGEVDTVPFRELERRVRAALRRYRAEVVITFGPFGITGHPDHRAVHQAVVAAFHRARLAGAAARELYYDAVPPARAGEMGIADLPCGQPNTWIAVTEEDARAQVTALWLHGRHIRDAREMAERLAREPALVATFYRAWPEVRSGERITAFLQNEAPEAS